MDFFLAIKACFLFFLIHSSCANQDEYHEELFIKPLNGFVYSYFQFSTLWNTSFRHDLFDNCHIFPRPMGEIIQRYNVQELHVSLTKGLWRYDSWGYPVRPAPPGAELWVWFKPNTSNIDTKWRELTGALSGLLCASLNFIDLQNTVSPRISLRPEGVDSQKALKDPENYKRLRYSCLPREIVCTENLTPWKKLLPCNLKSTEEEIMKNSAECKNNKKCRKERKITGIQLRGLAALLNSDYIYNTVYHSLGIHFKPVCLDKGCVNKGIQLVQTVSLVHDLLIISESEPQWSIRRLYGTGLGKACPLAKTANIYIDVSVNKSGGYHLSPNSYDLVKSKRGGQLATFAVYDTRSMGTKGLYNIEFRYNTVKPAYVNPNDYAPIVSADRTLIGYGQEYGGIKTRIRNRYRNPIKIVLLETIPWFISVYLHTLKIQSNGKELKPSRIVYEGGRERERPYLVELIIDLPPRSVTSVSLDFDFTFLKWQEYPPDAHHGFYAPAASITAFLSHARNFTSLPRDSLLFSSSFNASRKYYEVRLTTETLIISLATPDFSMPYNVICLACTVVALAFGPLHNITTKRFTFLEEEDDKSIVRKVLDKIMQKLSKRSKKKDEEEKVQEDIKTETDSKKDR